MIMEESKLRFDLRNLSLSRKLPVSALPIELRRNIIKVKMGNSFEFPILSVLSDRVSIDLFFRAVASQVFSAQLSLTSVFGMGTGGPSTLMSLTMVHLQGLEPWTHWLRVSCSTNWAKGASSYDASLDFIRWTSIENQIRATQQFL